MCISWWLSIPTKHPNRNDSRNWQDVSWMQRLHSLPARKKNVRTLEQIAERVTCCAASGKRASNATTKVSILVPIKKSNHVSFVPSIEQIYMWGSWHWWLGETTNIPCIFLRTRHWFKPSAVDNSEPFTYYWPPVFVILRCEPQIGIAVTDIDFSTWVNYYWNCTSWYRQVADPLQISCLWIVQGYIPSTCCSCATMWRIVGSLLPGNILASDDSLTLQCGCIQPCTWGFIPWWFIHFGWEYLHWKFGTMDTMCYHEENKRLPSPKRVCQCVGVWMLWVEWVVGFVKV